MSLGFGFGLPKVQSFIASAPTLSLNFAGADALPAALTFNRGTNATQFDSLGRLVWAPANHVLNTNFVAGWSYSDTTKGVGVTCPVGVGFEFTEGSAGTSTVGTTGTAVTGSAPHTVSIYAKGTGWVRMSCADTGVLGTNGFQGWFNLTTGVIGTTSIRGTGSVISGAITDAGGGWYRLSLSGYTSAVAGLYFGTMSAAADNNSNRVAGFVYSLAAAQIERYGVDSPKTFNPTSGTAYYGPRFDYDPATLAARGFLIEDTRTNNNTVSDQTGGTGGTNTAAPTPLLGWAGSRRFTGSGTSTAHFVSGDPFTNAASTVYTVSCFLKYVDTQFVQLANTISGSTATDYANFDLINGTISAVGATAAATITACGNGVYRCAMTFTSIAVPTAGASVVLYLCTSGTDTRSPVNLLATSVDFFGMQHEAGVSATSLIPTYGVAGVRAQDLNSSTGANFTSWFTSATCTIVYEAMFTHAGATGTYPPAYNITDGTSTNRYTSGLNNGTAFAFADLTSAGVNQASAPPATAITLGSFYKLASSYAVNNCRGCVNGGVVSSDTVASMPIGVSGFGLGITTSLLSIGPGSRWIKSFSYYPRADFTDAQLQALTV